MTGTAYRRHQDTSVIRVAIPDDRVAEIKSRLFAYLERLGIRDPELQESLAMESLHRAHSKVAPGSEDELLRRALEEIQRRVDAAVARAMGLSGTRDAHAVAAARAALLLAGPLGDKTEALVRSTEDAALLAEQMRAASPRPTPPEAPLSMHDQAISFFFSRSAK